ncbi:hypothetical protein ABC347_14310 [Sphingomonas sp. 1P06PA]|uniref:hypothetical protein n=1 Tax=Sphingomonas sp. 1P06PA TaxID=554121 RepID=UPI0039A56472
MTLIPIWTGTVEIPPLPRRRVQIGPNIVVQSLFSGATTTGRRMVCEIAGHDLLRTDLAAPFDLLLIRRPGARRHGGVISRDIRNFYTVCGQVQKSIVPSIRAFLPSTTTSSDDTTSGDKRGSRGF